MRFIPTLVLASTLGALLSHCAKSSDNMAVSPALPPAEEPSDDVKGAYAGDAGASQP